MKRIKYHYFPIGLDPKKFIKRLVYILSSMMLLEFVLYIRVLIPARRVPYYISFGEKILIPTEAIWNDLVMDSGMGYILISGSIVAIILPLIFFFSNYLKDNSIYTIMRIPTKGRVRVATYMDFITPSILLGVFLWISQFIMLLMFYWLYVKLIPEINMQDQFLAYFFQTNQFVNFYFPRNYLSLFCNIGFWILLPSIGMLLVFLGRNIKKCYIAVFPLIFIGFTIYVMAIPQKEGWQEIVTMLSPVVTAMSILTGLYYINKEEII